MNHRIKRAAWATVVGIICVPAFADVAVDIRIGVPPPRDDWT